MNAMTEIGEVMISDSTDDYLLRPSFYAMASIGTPEEIVSIYSNIHGKDLNETIQKIFKAFGKVPDHYRRKIDKCNEVILSNSMRVIQSCCEKDLSRIIGEWKGWKNCVVYRPGLMSKFEIIAIAQSLMTHGIIGKAKIRKLQRNENKSGYTSEFIAFEYISAARSHLNMSRQEAEQLTMTEFQLMMSVKFPEKGGFTREEYDNIADAYEERKRKRLENAGQ